MNRFKKISTKITVVIIALTTVSCIVLGYLGLKFATVSSRDALEKSMTTTIVLAAEKIGASIQTDLDQVKRFSSNIAADIENASPGVAESIAAFAKELGAESGDYTNTSGVCLVSGENIVVEKYFKEAVAGQTVLSEPVFNTDVTGYNYRMITPIWKGGVEGSEVMGTVFFVMPQNYVIDKIAAIKLGETGSGYALDKTGWVIAHANTGLVLSYENSATDPNAPKTKPGILAMTLDLMAGNTGFKPYEWEGVKKYGIYTPIPSTDGWGLFMNISQSEMAQTVSTAFRTMLPVTIALILMCVLLAIYLGKAITKPILQCTNRLKLLADGDFHSEVPAVRTKDETAQLLGDLDTVKHSLSSAISELSDELGRLANSDFSGTFVKQYDGDLEVLGDSIRRIQDALNEAFSRVSDISMQVANDASSVANGATNLAQGATEQASSITELSSAMTDISGFVTENTNNTRRADELSRVVNGELGNCNNQMESMVRAITDIAASSEKIGKIIKTIDDIAFQTNILALNAAVEAARAGEAGKGFAVVADEVRNLAQKSAEAAKNTTQLIEDSLNTVNNGVKISEDTFKSLSTVVSSFDEVTGIVHKISDTAEMEQTAVEQVTRNIDTITNAVNVTAATAEESAASSEELSSLTEQLNRLLNRIQLRR